MQKHVLYCLALLFFLIIISCVTTPEPHIPDYGEYPTNYKQIIIDHLHGPVNKGGLFDPDSIKSFKITQEPTKNTLPADYPYRKQPMDGYEVKAQYNCKNRMGGYTGISENKFLIKNGKVIWWD